MTKYHSDEYINFLKSITPDNVTENAKQMSRCTFVVLDRTVPSHITKVEKPTTVYALDQGDRQWCPPPVTLKRLTRTPISPPLFSVNVGEDCPVFDGLYEFCQLSAGGSLGESIKGWPRFSPSLYLTANCMSVLLWRTSLFSFFPIVKCKPLSRPLRPPYLFHSRRCQAQQWAGRHLHQLVRWPAPRQEERGVRLLLRQRHCPGHP